MSTFDLGHVATLHTPATSPPGTLSKSSPRSVAKSWELPRPRLVDRSCVCTLLTYWADEKDDKLIYDMMKSTVERVRSMTVEHQTALDFIYLNYAADFQDPIGSHGAENKEKLQDVSRRYDPEGLFQKRVPGGFKLF
ncbi:hypothetical protein F5Y18DRAFT_432862 [Xylariaceae sp. FL1019]|nr:hypothetical protein F5Y18DRAFT_432862 [Xylariaceae sp. FL1019]